MKRESWKVEYTGKELHDAAVEKEKHHRGRRSWWMNKRDETIRDIQTKGVTVDLSIVEELGKHAEYANTVAASASLFRSRDDGPSVKVDRKMQDDLREAAAKVRVHTSLIPQYNAWAQMTKAKPEQVFRLDHEDWMFFFGKVVSPE